MRIEKILLSVLALMLSTMTVQAERVTESDAALVADHFMNATSASSGNQAPAKRMKMQKTATAPEAQYYIYENADGEGWVIIAANDVVRPILAYSETGHFRTDNMPSNVRGWLQSYTKQIQHVARHTTDAPTDVKRQWAKLRKGTRQTKATVVVSPLIKTGWDQGSPYWNLCPNKGTSQCVTGCVATAMAQVMNYWKWPRQGTGSHTIPETSYSANFGETTYDWSHMLNTYSGGATSTQKTAVATLMYHCGVAVDMNYGTTQEGGSGAYTIDYNGYYSKYGIMCAETALTQFFGYNSQTVKGYPRDGYSYLGLKKWTKDEWIAMLKEELDAARPIMYAGVGCDDPDDSNTCYGHSFVCDGYDSDDYFHFNFGWSNWCDGYYEVDALNTIDPGTGGGNGNYNLQQDVIIGIEPPAHGHVVVKNATGCTIVCESFAENDEAFSATITPTNGTYDFTSLTVQLGSTTLTSPTHYTLSDNKQSLNIKASAITGDVSNDLTITAVWTKNRYLYEMLGENCDPEMDEGMLEKNAPLNLTILPTSGYTLASADCWDVEMGGNTLTFGTGFTYDEATGAFQIASVTGDVAIFAYGNKAVTWMSRGEVFANNRTADGKYVLPANEPENCSDSKVFVGWCTTADYQSETTAPSFIKDGDAATQDTLYAVFADKAESESSTWLLVTDASSLKAGDILVIANKNNYKTAGNISNQYLAVDASQFRGDSIITLGANTLPFTLGGTSGAWTLSTANGLLGATAVKNLAWDGGTTTWSISISGGDATIQNGTSTYGRFLYNTSSPRFTTYTTASSTTMQLPQLYRLLDGTSYSNYTTTCTAPEPVYYAIRFFNNGEQTGETQQVLKGQSAEVPEEPTCCEDYTFVGWWTEKLDAKNTEPKTWITNFTATQDQDYYAIYSKTETGESVLTNNYKKITSLDELTNGNYIVAGNSAKALKNTLYSNYYLAVSDVSPVDDIISNPAANIIWQITRDENSISFYNANANQYAALYQSGTHYNLRMQAEANWFTPSVTNGNWSFASNDCSGYYMVYFIYNNYTHEFAAKTSSTNTIQLFKQQTEDSSATYYSSTALCSSTEVANTAAKEKAVKIMQNGQIIIIRGSDRYTIFGQKIQ